MSNRSIEYLAQQIASHWYRDHWYLIRDWSNEILLGYNFPAGGTKVSQALPGTESYLTCLQ